MISIATFPFSCWGSVDSSESQGGKKGELSRQCILLDAETFDGESLLREIHRFGQQN